LFRGHECNYIHFLLFVNTLLTLCGRYDNMKSMDKKITELETIRDRERQARTELAELARRRRDLIRRLNKAGLSFSRIGEIYGVSRQRAEAMAGRDESEK
jgi:hypothetical protein